MLLVCASLLQILPCCLLLVGHILRDTCSISNTLEQGVTPAVLFCIAIILQSSLWNVRQTDLFSVLLLLPDFAVFQMCPQP